MCVKEENQKMYQMAGALTLTNKWFLTHELGSECKEKKCSQVRTDSIK